MRRFPRKVILLLVVFVAAGCGQSADLDAEKIALLRIHMADIKAHLDGDVPAIMETVGEEFMYVGDGQISRQTSAEIEKFFTSYLADATYERYEDLGVPHAEVSADGTMGWVVSRTAVTRLDSNGSRRSFTYAGIMTYEKSGGKWVKVANVSTFER